MYIRFRVKPFLLKYMRRIITIFLVVISQIAFAKTVIIGSGKGVVSKVNMNGLEPGDILAITPGKYAGGNFSDLKGISIINNNGLVTFNGKVELSGNADLTISGTGDSASFYGFYFARGGFTITKKCVGLRIYNCEARNISRFVDASENQLTLTYTGDTSTILMRRVAIANIKLNKCGVLFCGSFGLPHDLHNVVDSIAVFNVTYDSTNEEGMVVFGANIYRFDFHDIRIHEIPVYNNHDLGMFSVYGGNGQVHNVYRNGGWGWLCRMFGGSIDSVRDIWVYNNIDINSTGYGTADIRVESGQWGPSKFFTGVNIHIVNNTSGNKEDRMNYTTAVALIPKLEQGYTCEIKNNLSFNNQNPGRSGTGFEYWNIASALDTGGNFYFISAKAAGLKDSIDCYLLPESQAVDQGVSVSFVHDDIEGLSRPRGRAYDVGARESAFTSKAVSEAETKIVWEDKKEYFMLLALLVVILLGVFVLRKMRAENRARSGHRYSDRHNVKR